MFILRFSIHFKENIQSTGMKYRLLTEKWAAQFLLCMFTKEREGVNPKGNLNNGILFLYINKCSEKPQTLVHCCKKLVQFFSLKFLALKE